jgi:dienelactone hydrolase
MKIVFLLLALITIGGCAKKETRTLPEAKRGFQTKIVREESDREGVAEPPRGLFELVNYPSPVGELPAYLSSNHNDGKKHPAIVWITGGDSNSIGEVWGEADPSNDQSARAFRKAGVVMLFPSLRGGNLSKTKKESFFGEVDDILAAADFLAKQPGVDSKRIYLGGHSTGGTLVLLVAESSSRFRAVFSFGPVSDVAGYGGDFLTCEQTSDELYLRSPIHWLHGIKTPTFVFEGDQQGNASSVRELERSTNNPNLHFEIVPGESHFSVLAPTNQRLAQSVIKDTGNSSFAL